MKNLKNNKTLEDDYKAVFPNFEIFEPVREWEKEGDTIREFSMYDDYLPTYTSYDTVPIS
jgi:hypothetical protein